MGEPFDSHGTTSLGVAITVSTTDEDGAFGVTPASTPASVIVANAAIRDSAPVAVVGFGIQDSIDNALTPGHPGMVRDGDVTSFPAGAMEASAPIPPNDQEETKPGFIPPTVIAGNCLATEGGTGTTPSASTNTHGAPTIKASFESSAEAAAMLDSTILDTAAVPLLTGDKAIGDVAANFTSTAVDDNASHTAAFDDPSYHTEVLSDYKSRLVMVE